MKHVLAFVISLEGFLALFHTFGGVEHEHEVRVSC
jgi:hypothetical protein